jgi:signal transduction histidine kinase
VLHEFLSTHRTVLIDRCGRMVASRCDSKARDREVAHGVPMFLTQLIETLRVEQTSQRSRSREISGLPGGGTDSQIGDVATAHGRNLLDQGFTLEQVVRDYGDVCQTVTGLAYELNAPIEVDEFRTFNRCIDNAIASAVSAYAHQQTVTANEDGFQAINSRLGPLAHELRNYLHIATHALRAIQAGTVGISGATGAVLDRSLTGMTNLIDRTLAEVRVTAGLPSRRHPIRVREFLADAEAAASPDAHTRGCQLRVIPNEEDIMISGDPEMLHAAVFNLLHNAFKFTQRQTEVTLGARSAADRVLISVADHCGGLAAGAVDTLLVPFAQNGLDRSGLGLGLDICRRSVEANDGVLSVRDVPGRGCVFTIDLPRIS